MIDSALFDKLVRAHPVANSSCALNVSIQECIARMVRQNDRPFGGIQVSRLQIRERLRSTQRK